MAAGARIYREITWLNVDWRSEKWAAQKKKFVEYFGSETEWLNLWPIRSYLFANRSLRVIFFFPPQIVLFEGAALGEMFNFTNCSWNVVVQSPFFSIWPSWILGGASAAIPVVVVLSCLQLFNWWPEKASHSHLEGWLQACWALRVPATEGDSEPWLNRGATCPWWSWGGVLQVQDQTEEIERRFGPFAVP